MSYEINVSLNGKHFFATHERSITSEKDLKEKVKVFKEKFTKFEGYQITATHWQSCGKGIDIENM